MTLSGSIVALLSGSWSLTGGLAASKLRFNDGWFDKSHVATPQVTVSPLMSPAARFYGTQTVDLHKRFVVNVWHRIPVGAPGSDERTYIEQMREEAFEILNRNRHAIPSFNILVPLDEGIPRHEVDKEPYMLRFEMTVLGVVTRT